MKPTNKITIITPKAQEFSKAGFFGNRMVELGIVGVGIALTAYFGPIAGLALGTTYACKKLYDYCTESTGASEEITPQMELNNLINQFNVSEELGSESGTSEEITPTKIENEINNLNLSNIMNTENNSQNISSNYVPKSSNVDKIELQTNLNNLKNQLNVNNKNEKQLHDAILWILGKLEGGMVLFNEYYPIKSLIEKKFDDSHLNEIAAKIQTHLLSMLEFICVTEYILKEGYIHHIREKMQ